MSIYLPILLPLFLGVLPLSARTYFVAKYRSTELRLWYNSVIVTISSILIGVALALVVFLFQEKYRQDEARERYLTLLSAEVAGIRAHLSNPKRAIISAAGGDEVQVQVVGLQAEVLREAGRSGLFDVKASFDMLEMAQSIDAWNRKTEALLGAVNSQSNASEYMDRIRWYSANLDMANKQLVRSAEILTMRLKLKKWPTIE